MRRPLSLAMLGVAISGTLIVTATASPAAAQPAAAPSPHIVVADGMTQPVFSLADAIEERVFVQTPVDTDHDGKLDRVAIDISRPRETATQGFKVPVIFEQSPYRKDTWDDVPYPSVLVDDLPQNGSSDRSAARSPLDRPRTRRPRPTCPARSTTTTCPAATPWCSARASAPATRTAARPAATRPRRSAPRRSSTG